MAIKINRDVFITNTPLRTALKCPTINFVISMRRDKQNNIKIKTGASKEATGGTSANTIKRGLKQNNKTSSGQIGKTGINKKQKTISKQSTQSFLWEFCNLEFDV